MGGDPRSECPINLTLEVIGDKWSLLIIRDIMFGGRRHFRELLKSEEGIASNILADRLKRLVDQGILTKTDDPSHKQKGLYSLTEQGIELLPILNQMSVWGLKHFAVPNELAVRGQLMETGGAKMLQAFMTELREAHLGDACTNASRTPTAEKLQVAYDEACARRPKPPPAKRRKA